MQNPSEWALGPEVSVVTAELKDGSWQVSALGRGERTCPGCGTCSTARHSWHYRRLQDLPVQGARVTVTVRLGRWRCPSQRCERQTFVERLAVTAAPLARRTRRVADLVRLLGHTAGDRPGEMLMARLGMPASDTTIVRQLKRHAAARTPAPVRVLGIDDWSWCKGVSYGTVMVDLERRQVVDVLPDRSAAGTARWLERHPEVEIISRDRCGLYAQGARQGAPQAAQVADRFHLLQNLRACIESHMSSVSRHHGRSLMPASHGAVDGHEATRTAQRNARKAMFEQVQRLRAEGKTMREIATQTGIGWRTVTKWVRSGCLQDRHRAAPGPRSPQRFQDYLRQRWAEGCRHGRYLFLEIKHRGYEGSYSHLQKLLAEWRSASGEDRPERQPVAAAECRAVDPASGWQISPITAASLCMKPRGQLTPSQALKVQALKQASPSFTAMRGLVMRFRGILRSGRTAKLDDWLRDARASGIGGMQRFARTLSRDLEAVRNAVTEPWSNGQTEGQINKLKTLKRAMYGRAGAELLRARLLPLEFSE